MPAYTVIGGDQKQYGPVSEAELRAWIAEGRLNGQSLVQADGAAGWNPLATFLEFRDALAAQPVAPPPAALPPASPAEWAGQILARRPELPIGKCLGGGFSFLAANPGFVFSAVFGVWLANTVVAFTPLIGGILYLLLGGVFFGGLYLTCLRRLRGEPTSAGGVFDGFKHAFVQLMLASAMTKILTQMAFLLIVPGIYLVVAWTFALPLVADKRLEFWTAMELSRKVVTRVWFPAFLLLVIAFLPFLAVQTFSAVKLGALLFGFFRDANFDAVRAVELLRGRTGEITTVVLRVALVVQVVTLFNLFYAVGVIVHAYESLFGARKA